MIGTRLISEDPISFTQALDILEKRKEEQELEFEQRLAFDYLQKFSPLPLEKTQELTDELLEIEKIRRHQAILLTNNMPETEDDIRLIFSKERTSLREETVGKILKIIDNYRE